MAIVGDIDIKCRRRGLTLANRMIMAAETYFRIFGLYFLLDAEHQAIEYRIIEKGDFYQLKHRIHGDRIGEYITDWKIITHNSKLSDLLREVIVELRTIEIDAGLYKNLDRDRLPEDIYKKVTDSWLKHITRLECRTIFVHGNSMKYLPRPSKETTDRFLQYYQALLKENQWHTPSTTNLWLEEIVKKEIIIANDQEHGKTSFPDARLEVFLRKTFVDFQDQIGRYLVHLNEIERNTTVTADNRDRIQKRFVDHVHPESAY